MEHVIDRLGGTTVVARMLGLSAPSVTFWRTRGIPAERCVALERAVAGRVACEEMRPDAHWVRLPDAAWPWHPDGKPLLDLVAALPVAVSGSSAADALSVVTAGSSSEPAAPEGQMSRAAA